MSSKAEPVVLLECRKLNDDQLMGNHYGGKVGIENGFTVTDNNKNIHEFKPSSESMYSSKNDFTNNLPKATVPKFFVDAVKRRPNFEILKYKSEPKLKGFDVTFTMKQYYEEIKRIAKSFIELGVENQKSVCIMGFNSPEWFLSEMAAFFIGSIAVGVYSTNNADTCEFIMRDSQCQILVVENETYLEKLRPILKNVPEIRAIILYDHKSRTHFNQDRKPMEIIQEKIPVYDWATFAQLGANISDESIVERGNSMKPDDCCLLIYTSGTTGNPKGVIVTHDNILFTTQVTFATLKIKPYEQRMITYLPLSHIAANLCDLCSSFIVGITIYFAQPDALKGSLINTLKEVSPTLFFGVPRVFERMQESIAEIGAQTTGLRRKFADWAKKIGMRNSEYKMAGKPTDICYGVANVLFNKIKKNLGLDKCILIVNGAAPITKETIEFFMRLDIQIGQIYGMSECTGPHTITVQNNMKIGSVGPMIQGVELKLADVDKDGVGEICMRGRHVFKGYWNNREKTKEALDNEGWLHSGDLGSVRNERGINSLYITGRSKELIITAGGENIAPIPIEDRVKAELPFISNVMLVGDKLKFLSCLLTLKTKINLETQVPTNELTPMAIRKITELCGLTDSISTVEEVLELLNKSDSPLVEVLEKARATVNAQSVSRAAFIQKWKILDRDFSIPTGELGPTMKLKRPVVMDMYKEQIRKLYE